ncbi:ATP-binding protein [Paenibacillus sp. RC67]|uniref:ATP-binding protein n=1 Tax=Paenibacillus sp. RC67 TaxID=3039392 RepID=UPI0024AE4245|nr:ATP-binding protein [Paenibacillus sp. RC67]
MSKIKYVLGLYLLIFVTLQIWCSFITFHYPYIGIYLEPTPQQQWIIKELSPEGAGMKLDVQLGDLVQQVDGKPPEESSFVYKWRTIEQAQNFVIVRDGREYTIDVNSIRGDISYDIVPIIEESVCLIMAILLFVKMRGSSSARLLSAVFLTMAIIYMSMGASVRGDAVGKLIIASLMMLLPIVFYHFLVIFFNEKGNINLPSKPLKYLYSIVALSFGIRSLYFYPPMAYTLFRYHNSVTLSFFMVGFLFNMGILTILYVKVRKQRSYITSIIKSVWLSWMISFLPVICYSFLPKVIMEYQFLDAVYTSWIILFFPISFAYLIASDQLYDVGLVIRRILFAGLLAVIPVSLFTGTFILFFHQTTDEKQISFIFVGSLILLTSVLYAAEYWTMRLESFLFPRKFVLQSALKKISKNLGTISSFRELKDIILVDIVETLQVMGAAIVFQYKSETEIIYEGELDAAEIQKLVNTPLLPDHPLYTFIEMNSHEAYTSYLVITRKKTNMLLGKEEIQWLRLITSYLEVSLENVHLIRKLTVRLQQLASQLPQENTAQDIQWFRKVMFELQEEERIRIAMDLHDTTMQDLFFLNRRLAALGEKYALHKEDQEQLSSMIQFVEMINAGLRQSCFELNPHLLKEVGLIQTLEMYLEKEAYTTPFQLKFIVKEAYAIESKDLLTKRHIFRIVQELLNNAKKHSQATKVMFQITEANERFCLSYEDDGVGFDDKEVRQKRVGSSGMGIEQIRSRIGHMGGQLEFITQARRGMKVVISIPVEEVKSA